MPQYSKKDIVKFQKLYLHYYGKVLSLDEAEKRFSSLVRLLRLVREIPARKQKSETDCEINIKGETLHDNSTNTPSGNLSEPK